MTGVQVPCVVNINVDPPFAGLRRLGLYADDGCVPPNKSSSIPWRPFASISVYLIRSAVLSQRLLCRFIEKPIRCSDLGKVNHSPAPTHMKVNRIRQIA